MFEQFHKAKNALPDSPGLRLVITKEIISKHHGTVTAEHTGEGLRLTLCFPKKRYYKNPSLARYLTDKKNGAVLYTQAQRIMKIVWDREMRREGVKYFSGNYTEDHPPTLLKNTDAAVIARFTEALAPDIKVLFEAAVANADPVFATTESTTDVAKGFSDDPLLVILFENNFQTVFSDINKALETKAGEVGKTTEEPSIEASVEALDQWADDVIVQEIAIMIDGQKAKKLFALSKNVPQETDFSN